MKGTQPIGQQVEMARVKRRSSLYRWLYENYDELAPKLNVDGASWTSVADVYNETGPVKRANRQGVLQTWGRVKKAKSKEEGARVSARPEIPPKSVEGGGGSFSEIPPDGDEEFVITDLGGRRI